MKAKDFTKIPIEELTFSVVDVETTGMNSLYSRVMDIGIVTVSNGQIVSEWESLIDPKQEIPYWITFYTKLRNKHVIGQPVFEDLSETILEKLQNTVFVGHNVGFDYSFIYQEFARLGKSFYSPKLCTVLLSRKLLPQLPRANLDVVSEFYDIKISARHRALPDAQATALILLNFIQIAKEKYNAKTYFDLEKIQRLKIPYSIPLPKRSLFNDCDYVEPRLL